MRQKLLQGRELVNGTPQCRLIVDPGERHEGVRCHGHVGHGIALSLRILLLQTLQRLRLPSAHRHALVAARGLLERCGESRALPHERPRKRHKFCFRQSFGLQETQRAWHVRISAAQGREDA